MEGFTLGQYLLLVDYTRRLVRKGKAVVSSELEGIFERLQSSAEIWSQRIKRLHGKTWVGRFLSASRDRLRALACEHWLTIRSSDLRWPGQNVRKYACPLSFFVLVPSRFGRPRFSSCTLEDDCLLQVLRLPWTEAAKHQGATIRIPLSAELHHFCISLTCGCFLNPINMATVTHHRFTVSEYEQMIGLGILTENERVELIRGEVVEKMVIGPLHSATVKRINRLLTTKLLDLAIVSVQDPIVLEDSEPEPDFALLVPRDDFYSQAKPKSPDVRLVIEVADTSLAYDREIKLPLYADAGIQEYWIINLAEFKVEVYRQPSTSGSYTSRTDYCRGDFLSPVAFPEASLAIDLMLG